MEGGFLASRQTCYGLPACSCPPHPSAAALRQSSIPSTSYRQPARVAYICSAKYSKKDKEAAEAAEVHESDVRPWKFLIPGMDEILTDARWPEKVKDWLMFWGMVNNWLEAYHSLRLLSDPTRSGFVTMEQMEWLQINPYEEEKLEAVIDTVVDSIPELLRKGYPVAEYLKGKAPWRVGTYDIKFGHDEMGRRYFMRGKIRGVNPLWEKPPPVPEQRPIPEVATAKPWDNWEEGDFRAYMEKRKAHRRQLADFARRQAEVGSRQYLIVSPLTDSRWAKPTPFFPIDPRNPTHKEFMDVVRLHGRAVDPETINIRVQDPQERADAFEEGVHYVPDTIDYIRSIGHLVENEEDLIGSTEDSVPSATMEEEFPDIVTSPLDGLDSDLEDSMEAVSDADGELDNE